MALFDSLYSLNQASTNPVVQQPPVSPAPLSPFYEFSAPNSGGDPGLGKTQIGLGLSSLMGPQPLAGMQGRPPSPLNYEEQVAAQQQKRLDGDMGRYVGIGEDREGGANTGSTARPMLPTMRLSEPMLPPMPTPTMPPPMLPPMPTPTMPPPMPTPTMPPPMPTPTMPPPAQPTMPSATPMPGDVGYVPYGSSNNQLVPPGYEKPSFVQGLAGGGPIRNLSFVELLRQTMEN